MRGLGAGCRLAKGDGGSPDPFGCLSVPDFESEMGKCAAFALGAISPVIEAAVVLVDVRSGLANTKTSRNDMGAVELQSVGADSMRTSFESLTELSGEHDAGLGLSKGDRGLVGQKSLALGTGPINSSVSVAQSNVTFVA